MIPNLYNLAIGLIGGDEIYFKKFIENVENEVGQLIPTYEEPITIIGSFQTIDAALYSQLGLDLNKHYFNLYTDVDVLELEKGKSSDRVIFNEHEYQVLDGIDWIKFNGWKGVLCVRL